MEFLRENGVAKAIDDWEELDGRNVDEDGRHSLKKLED
jgi:hypothetical protein